VHEVGRVAAAGLVAVAGFQVALASGAPWGAAAWGGQHPGRLPRELRVASATSAGVLVGLAAVAATAPRPAEPWRRGVLLAAAMVLGVGVPLNLASPSPPERAWAPVAGGVAFALWKTART